MLWTTLPLRGVSDERETMEAYGFALEPFSVEAIRNTVDYLRRGEIEDASKQWCPRPPELAVFVRSEQKRLDALNRRPSISHQPVETGGYKDWRIIHRQKTKELEQNGYRLVQESVSIDTFNLLGRRKKWQIGATWFWSLQEVWAPVGAAFPSTGTLRQEAEA